MMWIFFFACLKTKILLQVFGYNRWLWFLPVRTSVGDGLSFPTRIHHQSRSYQSMSEVGLAGSSASGGNGMATDGDVAINVADLENGTALLPSSQQPQQPVQMTTVLDSNNRVSTRISKPDSSYSMQ